MSEYFLNWKNKWASMSIAILARRWRPEKQVIVELAIHEDVHIQYSLSLSLSQILLD